jgi:hypothetical protein
MRKTVVLILFIAAVLSAQTGNRSVGSSDPAVARILESLSHPSRATVEVQEIKIPAGEYTHCVARTNGNRTDSDCVPQTRFEEMHRLILTFSLDGRPVEVTGGCSSYEHDRRCGLIALGGLGAGQCRNETNQAGDITHPVEGKPNRRYYIPLARIDGATIVPD